MQCGYKHSLEFQLASLVISCAKSHYPLVSSSKKLGGNLITQNPPEDLVTQCKAQGQCLTEHPFIQAFHQPPIWPSVSQSNVVAGRASGAGEKSSSVPGSACLGQVSNRGPRVQKLGLFHKQNVYLSLSWQVAVPSLCHMFSLVQSFFLFLSGLKSLYTTCLSHSWDLSLWFSNI